MAEDVEERNLAGSIRPIKYRFMKFKIYKNIDDRILDKYLSCWGPTMHEQMI